jgi:DNA (cytosine-5)-methyltransferase 1
LHWSQLVDFSYWDNHNISQPSLTIREIAKAEQLERKYGMFRSELKPWVTVRDSLRDLPDPQDDSQANTFDHHEYKAGARIYPGHTGSYIDEPSKTLKAGGHGVPGGENMIRYENGTVRYFTVRESARIQTFPDDFIFSGSWGEVMRQLGNAVPSHLAELIGASVHSALNNR